MADNVVAAVLAGGKGTRLEFLTKKIAKPAVSFAAKYRIIDFPLSNLAHSGVNKVGVLTQYESTLLNTYIGNGDKWGFNGVRSIAATLAPHQTEEGANWYRGTADSIAQNISFFDGLNAEYILILSGDHIYKTTYNEMIDLHIKSKADVTISVMEVPWDEASRFGIMAVDQNDRITEFQEKPKKPKSNLASMGVYIFTWKVLRELLIKDMKDENSEHDFGKNIIPTMLDKGMNLQAYRFSGYWKDVGTIKSLHEANIDVALGRTSLDLFNGENMIFTEDTYTVPQYVGKRAIIKNSIVNQGAIILGNIDTCVISDGVVIEEGAELDRCVVMSGCHIGANAKIRNAIIAPKSDVKANACVNINGDEISLIYSEGK